MRVCDKERCLTLRLSGRLSSLITVPYWHVGEKARDAFKEIWSYLSLLEKEAGFVAYHPQVEKILDLTSDMPEVVAAYESLSKTM